MKHLLDTCVFSEYQNKKPNPAVLDWIDAQIEESLYISVLTVGEIQKGIAKLPKSKKQERLAAWLETSIYRFDKRILPVDLKILRRWGELTGTLEKKGRVLPIIDSLIAATALAHNLIVVTRNEEDFAGAGVTLLNVWK